MSENKDCLTNLEIDKDISLGIVKSVSDNKISVSRINTDSCGSCSMHGICGVKNQIDLVFKTSDSFKVGDTVEIIVSAEAKIFSAFIIFVFPILLMIIFYAVSFYFFKLTEGFSILLSIIGLVCSVFFIKIIDKRFELKERVRIRKVKINED